MMFLLFLLDFKIITSLKSIPLYYYFFLLYLVIDSTVLEFEFYEFIICYLFICFFFLPNDTKLIDAVDTVSISYVS